MNHNKHQNTLLTLKHLVKRSFLNKISSSPGVIKICESWQRTLARDFRFVYGSLTRFDRRDHEPVYMISMVYHGPLVLNNSFNGKVKQ